MGKNGLSFRYLLVPVTPSALAAAAANESRQEERKYDANGQTDLESQVVISIEETRLRVPIKVCPEVTDAAPLKAVTAGVVETTTTVDIGRTVQLAAVSVHAEVAEVTDALVVEAGRIRAREGAVTLAVAVEAQGPFFQTTSRDGGDIADYGVKELRLARVVVLRAGGDEEERDHKEDS